MFIHPSNSGRLKRQNRILKIPTRDGMALVFYKGPEESAC